MIAQLGKLPVFPDPNEADAYGIVAYGGDLSAERLLAAYAKGIFPWPHDDKWPLLWFSPEPRCVLLPAQVHIGRTLKKVLKKQCFEIRFDTAFEAVIRACAETKRKHEDGTWIISEMIEAYTKLHHLGFAHSVEAWQNSTLVGGLYGVSLGAAFFGESMFTRCDNASKVALVYLLRQLEIWQFHFVDCQMHTAHVGRLGAINWNRQHFLAELKEALRVPTRRGKWQTDIF